MLNAIAWGLEVGHPFAYLLVFLLVGYPILCLIILGVMHLIEKIKNKSKNT